MRDIVTYIRDSGLRVGDQLPSEGKLSQAFGVSRPVVREAFGALSALGVVDVGNGRLPKVGALSSLPMVVSIDHALTTNQMTFSEVWEVRRRIENGSAALAAVNRTDRQAQLIVDLAEDIARSRPQSREMLEAEIAFHRAVAEASGSVLIQHILESFHPIMHRAVPLAWSTRATLEQQHEVHDKHRAIASAIASQDKAGAERAMDAHFDGAVAEILEESARLILRQLD